MGTNDTAYVYGDANGANYDGVTSDDKRQTYWDARVSVTHFGGAVQVGVVPASDESTDAAGVWKNEDGQFLSLSRDGLNRLIRALQEAGAATYGRDAW